MLLAATTSVSGESDSTRSVDRLCNGQQSLRMSDIHSTDPL